ncbi:serine/threonine-protein kinase [Rhodococcus koreensis]|uniref:serine/threonine-protein kinase n=1 Tax=Rhodococcus koreensis TaxID=99653 RepID=UPI0036DD2FFC
MTDFIQLEDQWEVIGPIGDNPGMSEVFEVARGEERAVVKKVKKIEGGNRDLLVTELGECRNIVPFDEIFDTGDELLLRMPKAESSLNQRLESVGRFSETDTISVLTDVATSLQDMGNVIVHRDIKPQNILLYGGAWSLADFGIARYVEDATRTMTYKRHGSDPWFAPERWRMERATIKSDVYSLGVVAYQLVTGELPFKGPNFYEQHRDTAPPSPTGASPLLRSLILSMLAKSPDARPTPKQILERLATARNPVSSPAVSLLHQLAGDSAEKKAAADAAAAATQTKQEQRKVLAESAIQMAREYAVPITDQLSSLPGVRKSENSRETQFSFEAARLVLNTPQVVSRNDSMPFDVVCAASISVEMTNIQDRWAGRSHSLWYCDAQNEGEYHWFETAFHNMRNRRRLEPYDQPPTDYDAQMAVQRVIHTEQVAVPFTALVGESVDTFIEQWLLRFAQAAQGTLPQPGILPEGTPQGTWRN